MKLCKKIFSLLYFILQECDLEEPDGKMFSKSKVGVCTGPVIL
jgi:hypothetical protein